MTKKTQCNRLGNPKIGSGLYEILVSDKYGSLINEAYRILVFSNLKENKNRSLSSPILRNNASCIKPLHVKTEQKSYKKKKSCKKNPRKNIYNLTVREMLLTKSGNLTNVLDCIQIKNLCKQKMSEAVNMT